MKLVQKGFQKSNNTLCLKKRKRMMMMKQRSSQVEKNDVMLEDTMLDIVKEDTEILDVEEVHDGVVQVGVPKEDKKMKGIVESCCKQEDLPKYDLSNSTHTRGGASSASCDVCMAVFSISDFICAPTCDHRFCKDCIESYLLKEIQEDAMNVKCPESKCKEVLKPLFCRKLIPEQVFDRWKSEIHLASSFGKRKIQCPNSDCEEEFMDDGKGYKIRACPKCWNLICMPCGQVEWHMDEDCETFWRRKHPFYASNYVRRFTQFGRHRDPYLLMKNGLNMEDSSDNFYYRP